MDVHCRPKNLESFLEKKEDEGQDPPGELQVIEVVDDGGESGRDARVRQLLRKIWKRTVEEEE